MTPTDTTTEGKRRAGRPSLSVPSVEWKLQVPAPLAAAVELICFDTVRNKPSYGARSAYLSRLIREDLQRRKLLSEDGKESLTTSPESTNIIL